MLMKLNYTLYSLNFFLLILPSIIFLRAISAKPASRKHHPIGWCFLLVWAFGRRIRKAALGDSPVDCRNRRGFSAEKRIRPPLLKCVVLMTARRRNCLNMICKNHARQPLRVFSWRPLNSPSIFTERKSPFPIDIFPLL